MRRPIVIRLTVCCPTGKYCRPTVGQSSIYLIKEHDIIGLLETKMDTDAFLDIPGYKIFYHNRERISRYRSSGIALVVKEDLLPYVKVNATKSSRIILFFTTSKGIYSFENQNTDLTCGIVYIPP